MNLLLSNRPICFSILKSAPFNTLSHFSPFPWEKPNLLCYPQIRWFQCSKTSTVCFAGDSNPSFPASYGGWDDTGLVSDSDQFRNFLISAGVDHKKNLFIFIFGFLCALAISRVKVSSIVVFPASVLVFAVGFSFGFLRGGSVDELSIFGNKKQQKEEISRFYTENLRNLVEFFDGFAVKVDNLKYSIQDAIDSREITLGDLENYIKVLESNNLSTLNAKKAVEALISNGGNSKAATLENLKPTRKIEDLGQVGYELLQSFGSLLGEKIVGFKPNKVKNNGKRQPVDNSVCNDETERNSKPSVEANAGSKDSATDFNPAVNLGVHEESNKHAVDMDYFTRINIAREKERISSKGMRGSSKRFIDGEEYGYQNNRLRYRGSHLNTKMGLDYKSETSRFNDSLLDPMDFSFRMKHIETKTSFVEERAFKENDGGYRSSHMSKSENEIYRSQFTEEGGRHKGNSNLNDQLFGHRVSSSSSSMVYDDTIFNRYLMEANDLLKQAKDLMKHRHDEEQAEIILCQSANLLSKATDMKPMSLLAVGQLGNTYLLHGELKLRISRELRNVISGREPSFTGKWVVEGLDDAIASKDKLTSVLINVCEDCEELLVMAGRKYRMALSIDANDVRALYNWGLALSFRAQLIADIGPEAAFDADKVFLAAIDKFDAMMLRGNVYEPDALFRWAMALQQRSRLRPNNSKEKTKLLLQAKRLYEDSLNMDSDNLQAREALVSCISELQFEQY